MLNFIALGKLICFFCAYLLAQKIQCFPVFGSLICKWVKMVEQYFRAVQLRGAFAHAHERGAHATNVRKDHVEEEHLHMHTNEEHMQLM